MKRKALAVLLSALVACLLAVVMFGCKKAPETYTVTYIGGEGAVGTAPVDDVLYKKGEKVTLKQNTFTKEGYEFTVWNDGSKDYAAGGSYEMPAKNVTFTAQWANQSTEKYTVTFKNGDTVIDTRQAVKGQGIASVPEKPQTEGNETFLGWYLSDGTQVSAGYVPTDNVIATAKWQPTNPQPTEEKYTVTFKDGDTTVDTRQAVKGQGIASVPGQPQAEANKTFLGWYLSDGKTQVSAGYIPTGNVTATAKWNTVTPANPADLDYTAGRWGADAYGWTLQKGESISYAVDYTSSSDCKKAWNGLVVQIFSDGLGEGSSYFIRPDGKATVDPWDWDTSKIDVAWSGTFNEATYIGALKGAHASATVTVDAAGTVKVVYTFTGTSYNYTATYTIKTKTSQAATVFFAIDSADGANVVIENGKLTVPATRTVTINTEGGVFNPSVALTQNVQVGATGDPEYTLPAAPEKEEFTFLGWKVNNGTTPLAAGEKIVITGNTSLTAAWEQKKYDVTYAKGADDTTIAGVPTEVTKYAKGATVTLPANPTRTGYTGQWKVKQGDTDITVSNGKFTMPSGAVTVTATWTINSYKVTYSAGAGVTDAQGTIPTEETKDFGAQITVAAGLTRTGYTFSGWSYKGQTYQPNDVLNVGAEDIAFTAVWVAEGQHAVTYSAGAGVTGVSVPETASYAAGTEVTVSSTVPVRDGYEFEGWTVTSGGNPVTVAQNKFTMPSADVVITAAWKKVYTVTYSAGTVDSSISGMPTDTTKYEQGETVTVSSAVPTRTDYAFDGWTYNEQTYKANDTIAVGTEDITLTAVWKVVYTVTLKLTADAETEYATLMLKEGATAADELAKVEAPKKDYYRFDGWFLSDNTAVDDEYVASENVTATAKFTQVAALPKGEQNPSVAHPIEFGDSNNELAFSDYSPEWIGKISKGEVVTLTGTITSEASQFFYSISMYLYSGLTPTSILRSDWYFLGEGFNRDDINVDGYKLAPKDEAFEISKSGSIDWNTFKAAIANAKVTITFDYLNPSQVVVRVKYVGNNNTTHEMAYTAKEKSGAKLAETYSIGLGGENCHVKITNEIEIGNSSHNLAFTGWTPSWTGRISKGEVITFTGTHTAIGDDYNAVIMYVYSGANPTSVLRGDSWFLGKADEDVENANKEDNRYEPDGEAFWISKNPSVANLDTFAATKNDATVTITFDYSDSTKIVVSVKFEGKNNVTNTVTYTLAPKSGATLANSYNIGLGGEKCHVVVSQQVSAN